MKIRKIYAYRIQDDFINIYLKMEKQIILTNLKAKFTKDLETFGKMDPFLLFTIEKSECSTQVAKEGGKYPSWETSITLNFFEQTIISVKAMEKDVTSDESIGQGKIDVKTLKNNGALEFKIEADGQQTGSVTCQYVLKTLPPSPLLLIKNIKCDFFKETKFLLKSKPYLVLKCGSQSMSTEAKEEGNSKILEWNETLRVRVNSKDHLQFDVYDKGDESRIFGYKAFIDEFKTLNGRKKFNVIDKWFEPLGVLEFDYQTSNLVKKEESLKNETKAKNQADELTSITINKITGKMTDSGEDIYFKINVGSNMVKTKIIQNAKKDFVMEVKESFYAESKQNKMIFAAFDKDLISDDVLGFGTIALSGLNSGQKTITLRKNQKRIGQIFIHIETKKVRSRNLKLTDIKVKLNSSGDILGGSEPYVVGRIGGWANRTETGDGQEVSFKKDIQLKFNNQDQVTLEIWEEDINEHDKLFQENILVKNLKAKGELTIPLKSDEKKKEGTLSLKYETKNVIEKKQEPKKQPKKEETIKPQNSRKSESVIKKEPHEEEINKLKQDRQKFQESLFRSKNSSFLPSLGATKNFGDKIFDLQSSATLQKSIHVYSIPKAQRFGNQPKYTGQPSYAPNSTFGKSNLKGAGFGYGNKVQFPEWMQRNMKENPAPGAYIGQQNTSLDFRPKGPTFGIPHKYYEKAVITKEKQLPRISEKNQPIK